MILTGKEIEKQVLKGRIEIYPFNLNQINPNSYNLRLSNEIYCYANRNLDSRNEEKLVRIPFPETGLLIEPGNIYLGRTVEKTASRKYVPIVEGRSSIGRLGVCIHLTAGFGDLGFNGYWTLEISCVQPVTIYPFEEVCQVYWNTTKGSKEYQYDINAKYNYNHGVQASKLWTEYADNKQ